MSPQNSFRLVLSDQGSNLDSSEPKSDVLPVTPSDIVRRSMCEGGPLSIFLPRQAYGRKMDCKITKNYY